MPRKVTCPEGLLRLILICLFVILLGVGPSTASNKLYCHGGHNAGSELEVQHDTDLELYSSTWNADDKLQARLCRWKISLRGKIEAANVLIELQTSRPDQQVAQRDRMPNTTVHLLNDSQTILKSSIFDRNASLFRVENGESLEILTNIDNATAVKMNNNLFFKVTIAIQSDRALYIVRSVNFVCGSVRPLSSCQLLSEAAARFTSKSEIRSLVQNADLKRALSDGSLLVGLRCCNGTVAYPLWNSSRAVQWLPVLGVDHNSVCNSTAAQSGSLVKIQALHFGSTTKDSWEISLSTDNKISDDRVLLNLRLDPKHQIGTDDSCADRQVTAVKSGSQGYVVLAFVLSLILLASAAAFVVYKRCNRPGVLGRDNNENNRNDQYESIAMTA